MKTRIAILGYGNLGKGVERAVKHCPDMELIAVLTRREPESIVTLTGVPVYSASAANSMKNDLDVLILCGGSANDLPAQTPEFAKSFNVVDSFDNHAAIPAHFDAVDASCRAAGTVGIISVGWDPGLFSVNRLIGQAVLPDGCDYTFWGRGVSQGHSDAVRRIEGVLDAKQYTVPVVSALERVKNGETPSFTTREKHTRECFVVAKKDANLEYIEKSIKNMPGYFSDYDTTVTFVTQEELDSNHYGIPHGGRVIRSGATGDDRQNKHILEFSLKLDSNPEFTSGVLVAYARAAARLAAEGVSGCKTVLDVPPAYIHPLPDRELRKTLL